MAAAEFRYLAASNFESLLAQLIEAMFPDLVAQVRRVCGTRDDRSTTSGGRRSRPKGAGIGGWLERATAIGIDVRLGSALTVSVRGQDTDSATNGTRPNCPECLPSWSSPLFPIVYRTSGSFGHGQRVRVPFIVPIPSSFQLSGTDFPAAPTLGHLLAVVSSDPLYLSNVNSVVALVPIVVAALIQLPARSLPHQELPQPVAGSPELREVSSVAARWLSGMFPSDILRGHPAEQTIHKLVLRLLTRTDDSPRTSRTLTP